jgi:hypothetical protein
LGKLCIRPDQCNGFWNWFRKVSLILDKFSGDTFRELTDRMKIVGDPDLIAGNLKGRIQLYRNTDCKLESRPTQTIKFADLHHLKLADTNSDGSLDMICYVDEMNYTIFTNNGRGYFEQQPQFSPFLRLK